jgi:heavy metal sensor kinase
MKQKRPPFLLALVRGLRFRLTLSYALFFGIFLVLLGAFIQRGLEAVLEARMKETVEEEWGAVKGYLRIEHNRPLWFYDSEDPEEAAIVERLRRILLLTDLKGQVVEVSNAYRAIAVEEPEEIAAIVKSRSVVWKTKENSFGDQFLVRYGILVDGRKSYFLGVGRALMDDQAVLERFMRGYYTYAPVAFILSLAAGWFAAGRGLRPVNDLARTAGDITGSKMDLRIPLRHSGDELDHLIETFNGMMNRLSASFEQIRQFSTDVSHELRTPLTAIRGQLEVALFSAHTNEQYREAIENALQDVERLTQIVNSLLLLSRAESGQQPLALEPHDLTEIALESVELFAIAAEEAGLRLESRPQRGCWVRGDRLQLERMLHNLLGNAVKYTASGGRVRVEVNGKRIAGRDVVSLVVEDTGRGIPEQALPHIFDRFYRVAGIQDPEKGLGLGLSFVAWIVKAHGGSVEVKSQEGAGARFEVTLPACPPPGKDAVLPKEDVRPHASSIE